MFPLLGKFVEVPVTKPAHKTEEKIDKRLEK